jgi:hypothetical protein
VAADFEKCGKADRMEDDDEVIEEALSKSVGGICRECATHAAYVNEIFVSQIVGNVTNDLSRKVEKSKRLQRLSLLSCLLTGSSSDRGGDTMGLLAGKVRLKSLRRCEVRVCVSETLLLVCQQSDRALMTPVVILKMGKTRQRVLAARDSPVSVSQIQLCFI